jgi:hypothetical protein
VNIFYLDLDPKVAAKMHCDLDTKEQCAVTIMAMLNAHSIREDKTPTGYGINGGWTAWVNSSRENYLWAWRHAKQLSEEYTKRYSDVLEDAIHLDKLRNFPKGIESNGEEKPYLNMPNAFKHSNCEAAYRRYYRSQANKRKMFWLRGTYVPDWWKDPQYWYNTITDYQEAKANGTLQEPEHRETLNS